MSGVSRLAKRKHASKNLGWNNSSRTVSLVVLLFVSVVFIAKDPPSASKTRLSEASIGRETHSDIDYHVDEACERLPTIRPSGSYFLDGKIQGGASSEGIAPAFKVGSYYADKVPYHMGGDRDNFQLIKEALRGQEGGLAIDFGANQGFYTYYLASLGMQVHSFEINEKNFKALQHGAEFNAREVADRVHVYPVGIGATNARFGMRGGDYMGYLEPGKAGPILGATFDCFAHHTKGTLDLSRGVAFVKLDVEGFEIAVLRGAKHSLFRPGSRVVRAMVAEVGPNRWGRAGVDLAAGAGEMAELATHFRKSFVLLRGDKNCPHSLADGLADQSPRILEKSKMHEVKGGEWGDLMKKMEVGGSDCNFFYEN